MIEQVAIENFRALRHVRAPMKPLTVLIGQNDSGKSSFLAALRVLSGDADISIHDHWRASHAKRPRLTASGDGQTIQRGSNPGGEPAFLTPMQLFMLPAVADIPMSSVGAVGLPQIERNGSNVPSLIDYLLRTDRQWFDRFVAAVRNRIPGLANVNVRTPTADRRSLELVIDDGFRLPAEQASAGVRLLLFFVALAHHPQPPKVVLIEEPENGLHPRRLKDVVSLLRGMTTGAVGKQPTQVILTTHSPLLLDEIDLATDQVLVFRREQDGARSVEAADRELLKVFLDEFKLGEVWFNREEQGLVAKPGA